MAGGVWIVDMDAENARLPRDGMVGFNVKEAPLKTKEGLTGTGHASWLS